MWDGIRREEKRCWRWTWLNFSWESKFTMNSEFYSQTHKQTVRPQWPNLFWVHNSTLLALIFTTFSLIHRDITFTILLEPPDKSNTTAIMKEYENRLEAIVLENSNTQNAWPRSSSIEYLNPKSHKNNIWKPLFC